MARSSNTENNTANTTATRSTSHPDSASPMARPESKGAAVAKWLRRIISTVVVLAVLAAVGVVTVTLIQGTWQLNPVVSGSMRPGFTVGGVVISERVPVDQLALRDVIVFRSPDNPADLIVHRIVAMSKSKSGQLVIKTQGDANTVKDPWTLTIKGNYAYVVRWSLPLLGYVAVAYQNHRGLVLLGAGIVLIAAAASAILKQRRRDVEPSPSGESSSPSFDDDAPSHTVRSEDEVAPWRVEAFSANPGDSSPQSAGEFEPTPPPTSERETPVSDAERTPGHV